MFVVDSLNFTLLFYIKVLYIFYLKADLVEKDKALKRAQEENIQLRRKVANLQHDLENTEKTSQDFVRLSQHLQVCHLCTLIRIKVYLAC